MNPTTVIVVLAAVASVSAYPPATSYVSGFGSPFGLGGFGWGLGGGRLAVAAPVAVGVHGLGGRVVAAGPVAVGGLGVVAGSPLVNTIAAVNSGAISAANTHGIRVANSISAAGQAAANDANNLARAINQQSETNRNAAIQAAADQRAQINQLNAISQAQRVNLGTGAAQSAANSAALRQASANQATAAQLNAINGGATRDAAINQANAINQVAAVNANAAHASILNSHGVVVAAGGPVVAVHGGSVAHGHGAGHVIG